MNIEERISKLERESRNWRRVALGLALLIGAFLSCSQEAPKPASPSLPSASAKPASPSLPSASADAAESGRTLDTIRVKNLEIVNDRGQIIAGLKNTESGPELLLSKPDFSGQIRLAAANGGLSYRMAENGRALGLTASGLGLYSTQSGQVQTSVLLAALEGSGGAIAIYNALGKVVVSAHSNKSNNGSVSVQNALGKTIVSAQSDDANNGLVSVRNAAEQEVVAIGGGKGLGGGIIDVYNPLGKVVVSAESNKANEGALYINDVNGKISNVLTARP